MASAGSCGGGEQLRQGRASHRCRAGRCPDRPACPHVGGTHAGGVGGVVVGLALRFTFSSHPGPIMIDLRACGRVPAEDGPDDADGLLAASRPRSGWSIETWCGR